MQNHLAFLKQKTTKSLTKLQLTSSLPNAEIPAKWSHALWVLCYLTKIVVWGIPDRPLHHGWKKVECFLPTILKSALAKNYTKQRFFMLLRTVFSHALFQPQVQPHWATKCILETYKLRESKSLFLCWFKNGMPLSRLAATDGSIPLETGRQNKARRWPISIWMNMSKA